MGKGRTRLCLNSLLHHNLVYSVRSLRHMPGSIDVFKRYNIFCRRGIWFFHKKFGINAGTRNEMDRRSTMLRYLYHTGRNGSATSSMFNLNNLNNLKFSLQAMCIVMLHGMAGAAGTTQELDTDPSSTVPASLMDLTRSVSCRSFFDILF